LAREESVKIAWTADRAELMKSWTHVSVGVKITDHNRRCPITKKPLFMQLEYTGSDVATYLNVQSRELCCILVVADAYDSKSLYSYVFDEHYKAAEKL